MWGFGAKMVFRTCLTKFLSILGRFVVWCGLLIYLNRLKTKYKKKQHKAVKGWSTTWWTCFHPRFRFSGLKNIWEGLNLPPYSGVIQLKNRKKSYFYVFSVFFQFFIRAKSNAGPYSQYLRPSSDSETPKT